MKDIVYWCVVNVAIVGLVAFAVWYTSSLWALAGLFFLFNHKNDEKAK